MYPPHELSENRDHLPRDGRHQALKLCYHVDSDGWSLHRNGAEELDSASSASAVDKTLLGVTAVALNPLGAGIAYALSKTIRSEEDHSAGNLVDCPECGIGLELSGDEMIERRFTCPECDQDINLDDFAVCPSCRSELELDADEQIRGWYICPECRRAVRL